MCVLLSWSSYEWDLIRVFFQQIPVVLENNFAVPLQHLHKTFWRVKKIQQQHIFSLHFKFILTEREIQTFGVSNACWCAFWLILLNFAVAQSWGIFSSVCLWLESQNRSCKVYHYPFQSIRSIHVHCNFHCNFLFIFLFFFPSCKERRGECFPLLWVSLSVFAYVSVESEKVSGEKLSDDEEGEGILSRLKRKLFGWFFCFGLPLTHRHCLR